MATKNIIKILFITPLFLFGCIGIFDVDTTVPKGDYDIVYQTEIDGNEILGFSSLKTENPIQLKSEKNLSSPYFLKGGDLITLWKDNGFDDPTADLGYIEVLHEGSTGLFCKKSDFYTYLIRPYGNRYVFLDYNKGIIKVGDPKECKIVGNLLDLDMIGLSHEEIQNISGFSVNPDSNIMVLSYEDRMLGAYNMIRVNLSTKEIYNYQKFGINPSISPDGKKVAYLSEDSIRIMDIDGNEILKVSESLPFQSQDNLWPKPEWSPEGTQLIYSQCSSILNPPYSCHEYGKYNVFIFDIKTGVQRKLIDYAANPSWIKK
jgi:WD40 repeat protein